MRYRAIISAPIEAEDDEEALEQGYDFARSLTHPGSAVIAGHLELLGETRGGLTVHRAVWEDPRFRDQLPARENSRS
jgi:hypothetical protein